MDYFNAQWEKYNYKVLQDTLNGVCNLHRMVTSVDEDGKEYYYCDACAWSYPCPTMKVIKEKGMSNG